MAVLVNWLVGVYKTELIGMVGGLGWRQWWENQAGGSGKETGLVAVLETGLVVKEG